MMALGDLFVHVYVLVDDAPAEGTLPIPSRPGPTPACSDAEVLTIALVRHLLARPSERGFLAEVRRDWRHSFPAVPAQSEFHRRVRWLWGALEQLRQRLLGAVPADGWQQIDTTALPVKHPSRVRGPDAWHGPGELRAGFGWDAAHREWFYDFRLGLRMDLGRRLVRAWGIVPAAVDERAVADDLLDGAAPGGRARAAWHARGLRPRPGRPPAPARRGPPPGRQVPQSHRDDHRRAHRGPRPGSPPGEGLLGPAHPLCRHDPGPLPHAARPGLTDEPTLRA